jgi:hypothetical protein
MFAIEAVALFDHYHFRKVMQTVTQKEPPLTLWYPGKPNAPIPWWKQYYDTQHIQMRDRLLFAGPALAARPRRHQECRLVGDRRRAGQETGHQEEKRVQGGQEAIGQEGPSSEEVGR